MFTDSLEPSGVGAVMLALAAELRGRYALSLICPAGAASARLRDGAAALGLNVLAADALRDVPDWHRARAWLAERRVSLLHVHAGITWEGLSAPNLARAAGVGRVVRHEHLPIKFARPADRRAYLASADEVDGVLCVSGGVADSVRRAGVPRAALAVVRNGIPDRKGAPIPTRPKRPTYLCVARFTHQKGHKTLLDAWGEVVRRAPEAELLLVGTGPLERGLRALARRRGLAGVRFLGPRSDVPALMARTTALVLPSRYEGLPLVVLEAMAQGLPAIATRVCGNEEAVADGRTGLLVPPDDPAALAAAMIRLATAPAEAERMGLAGRARYRAEFTAARMAREVGDCFDALIGIQQADPARHVEMA